MLLRNWVCAAWPMLVPHLLENLVRPIGQGPHRADPIEVDGAEGCQRGKRVLRRPGVLVLGH